MKPKYEFFTEGSYGKNPVEIRRCIHAEVSVKKSEEIVGGILGAFFGTNLETITIGTGIGQDAHGRIHEGETPGEVPCGISERIPEKVSE